MQRSGHTIALTGQRRWSLNDQDRKHCKIANARPVLQKPTHMWLSQIHHFTENSFTNNARSEDNRKQVYHWTRINSYWEYPRHQFTKQKPLRVSAITLPDSVKQTCYTRQAFAAPRRIQQGYVWCKASYRHCNWECRNEEKVPEAPENRF